MNKYFTPKRILVAVFTAAMLQEAELMLQGSPTVRDVTQVHYRLQALILIMSALPIILLEEAIYRIVRIPSHYPILRVVSQNLVCNSRV
jgi:hypothetical protein